MQIDWDSFKAKLRKTDSIGVHEDEHNKLKSICYSFIMRVEAKEDELTQLRTQQLGISTNLANEYRGKK